MMYLGKSFPSHCWLEDLIAILTRQHHFTANLKNYIISFSTLALVSSTVSTWCLLNSLPNTLTRELSYENTNIYNTLLVWRYNTSTSLSRHWFLLLSMVELIYSLLSHCWPEGLFIPFILISSLHCQIDEGLTPYSYPSQCWLVGLFTSFFLISSFHCQVEDLTPYSLHHTVDWLVCLLLSFW